MFQLIAVCVAAGTARSVVSDRHASVPFCTACRAQPATPARGERCDGEGGSLLSGGVMREGNSVCVCDNDKGENHGRRKGGVERVGEGRGSGGHI